ncbi:MAG: right-handed parallel beta-helix repeat-containing protein [Kiritimatiellia bacterium]
MKKAYLVVMVCLAASGGLRVIADTHYAAQNGQAPGGSFNTWETAASNIQDAVNAAAAGDTVMVGAGRYTLPPNPTNYGGTNVVFAGKPLILRSSNGSPESVIIDGEGKYRGIAIYAPFVLAGFTISNCVATNYGGGILVVQAAGTGLVSDCIITDNSVGSGTASQGGGVWAGYSAPLNYVNIISNCAFRNNRALSASGRGGGLFVSTYIGCSRTTDTLFENNSAGSGGGIDFHWGGQYYGKSHEVERCVIRSNMAAAAYGGAGLHGSTPNRIVVRNCLMCNNRATNASGYGGAFAHEDNAVVSTQFFYNCTIVSNMAPAGGGGVFIRDWSSVSMPCPIVEMYNTIVCSNGSDNISMKAIAGYSNIILNSCSFPSNANFRMSGTGNITNPPAFVDFTGKDFRQAPNSPAVNSGMNQPWMEGAVDLDGRSRIDRFSGRIDMGCYEYMPRGIMFKVH